MRIIAGTARGRRLFAPEGSDTRPTADRVRESVFNILRGDTEGARVLDLFAGSGALGLECLSRGAKFAVFNDSSRAAVRVVKRNVELMGVSERCRVLCKDYLSALGLIGGERFTLVFLDPPYRLTEVYGKAVEALDRLKLLAEDAIIVMERDAETLPILPEGFVRADTRKYRDTAVDFVRRVAHDGSLSGEL